MEYDQFYVHEGYVEPQYTNEDERKPLIDGMEIAIEKIRYEVFESIKRIQQITNFPVALESRMEDIKAF